MMCFVLGYIVLIIWIISQFRTLIFCLYVDIHVIWFDIIVML